MQGIWVLKMGCEGHFSEMQSYLREQVINKKLILNNYNMIQFGVYMFGEYTKFIHDENSEFGEKLLDYLVEVIQGPCPEN